MDIYLESFHPVKRFMYKAASMGLYPTIFSTMGFAYIGAPSSLQNLLKKFIPSQLRDHMLMLWNPDGWLFALFVVTIFCAIWGGLGSQLTVSLVTKKYKNVLDENDQLRDEANSKNIDCYKLFSNYLYSYFKRFSLSCDERVSLYKLDMDMFSCIGRYSDNEVYKSKPNRFYPKNQGCIEKAWEIGSVQDTDAPDPIENLENWKLYHINKYNFTRDQIDRIRMRSRAFYGIGLKDAQNVTVAVLLFESLKVNGIPFSKIEKYFKTHERNNIVNLIESLRNHIPSLEEARSEGF